MQNRETILIMSGDAARAAALARVIEPAGYRAEVAGSTHAARQSLERTAAGLLLADLPGAGAEVGPFLREVAARHADLPVLVVASEDSIEAAIEAGAADFVREPVHPGELRHRVERILLERRRQAELEALRSRLLERERAAVAGDGPLPGAEQSRPDAEPPAGNGRGDGSHLVARLLNSDIPFDEFEKEILMRALRRTRGNQTRAARLLGMTRRTLQYRIEKFDIDCAELK